MLDEIEAKLVFVPIIVLLEAFVEIVPVLNFLILTADAEVEKLLVTFMNVVLVTMLIFLTCDTEELATITKSLLATSDVNVVDVPVILAPPEETTTVPVRLACC